MKKNVSLAAMDFRRARRRAALQQVMARVTGKSAELLSFEEVRQLLKPKIRSRQHLEEIPLEAIVGSVGRYTDFTRGFLPRHDSNESRWARVKAAVDTAPGVPPIRVYKIDEAYFVLDGNHRVSVARENGETTIQAYVTEMTTKVSLVPEDQPDDLILKAEYADFLARTRLDELRPGAALDVTAPGRYQEFLDQIEIHRYILGAAEGRDVPYQEAVLYWYDEVYLPIVESIQSVGVLRDFPGRTETDLYAWISRRRAELEDYLGWPVPAERVAADLAERYSPRTGRVVARVGERLLESLIPEELAAGPPPGRWREIHEGTDPTVPLFADVLVAISPEDASLYALDQSLVVASRSDGRLHGLHVVPTDERAKGGPVDSLRAEFERRCRAAGVAGELAVGVGTIAEVLCDWSRWVDLLVLPLAHPPEPQPLAKLGSGFRTLIRRCASPLLAVPGIPTGLDRALLAYDGSPKAREALFIAAFLAGKWEIPLVVLSVEEGREDPASPIDQARAYLESISVEGIYRTAEGPVSEAILHAAVMEKADFIVMGGYGFSPVLEVVLGSAVDQVLRESRLPLLICR